MTKPKLADKASFGLRLLGCVEDVFENFRFVLGEIGQDFPVEGDIGLEEPVDEFGIGGAVLAGGGVDFDGPEIAHRSFFLFSVGELE